MCFNSLYGDPACSRVRHLANSTNVGHMETDTFVCDVWTKAGGSLAAGGA
jgi:hypothetical protein